MENRDRNPSRRNLVKVLFQLNSNAWHGSVTETLWAEPIGTSEYRLENVPFYVFDVSFGDIVGAKVQGGISVFTKVIRRGGHSTYRLLVNTPQRDEFERFWTPLQAQGCTYEEGPNPLLAVDVPPTANIVKVYQKLEDGEQARVWSFEEGHCGHPTA